MEICENCYGSMEYGVELEDGRLLCPVCYRQWEEEERCDFRYEQRIEKEIREGSIE